MIENIEGTRRIFVNLYRKIEDKQKATLRIEWDLLDWVLVPKDLRQFLQTINAY
jgi:hypothetical protein